MVAPSVPVIKSKQTWQVPYLLLALFLFTRDAVSQVVSQPATIKSYTEVFYKSSGLRIQAYLYKPQGDGPFPLVIYNHGSRFPDRQRTPIPVEFIGSILMQAGYAVLVPERRGYGHSDGPTLSEEVGRDSGSLLIARLQSEADDVIAALEFIKTLPFVDARRIGIMGVSHGGIVTMFAAGRSSAFQAVVNQAGGSLTWPRSAALREAMVSAARKVNIPVLLLDAENDRTTDSVVTVGKVLQERNMPHQLIIYPPFMPSRNPENIAPGHLIFGREGSKIWANDVLAFFRKYLGGDAP